MDKIELVKKAVELGMSLEKDNYGMVVIYTNLKEDEDGKLVEMTEKDFEDEEAWYKP